MGQLKKRTKTMKTMKHLFGALPLAALSFTACGNDETFGEPETTPAGNQVTMTFTANALAPAAGTRTSLQPGDEQGSHAVYWTPNDVIGVYSCTSEGYSLEEPGSPFTTDLCLPSRPCSRPWKEALPPG